MSTAGTIPTNVSTMVPILHLEYNNFQAAPSTWYAASQTNSSNWYLSHISMQVRMGINIHSSYLLITAGRHACRTDYKFPGRSIVIDCNSC